MSTVILEVEGIVSYMISGRDSPSHGKDDACICCSGPHVFGAGIDFPADNDKYADVGGYVHDALIARKHDDIEGKRVRVTVELFDDE